MKIIPGVMAGAASGKLGSQVFSHNRYGAYVRAYVIPTKTITTYTEIAKAHLIAASQAWASLDPDQQAAWRTWAQSNPITDRLGQKQVLDGHAAYVQLNARLLLLGVAQIEVPPVIGAPAALATASITATAPGTAALAFTGTVGAGKSILANLAVVDSAGVRYFRNLVKQVIVSAAAPTTPLAFGADLTDRFGTLLAGQSIGGYVYVADRATGLISAPLIVTAVVAGA